MKIVTTTLIRTVLLCCTLAVPTASIAQQTLRSDGNWWVSQSLSAKEAHLHGVKDGLMLEERLVLRSSFDGGGDNDVIRKRQAESMAAPRRLLKSINSNQIRDGLDAFYADFRNRQITLPDGLQIVIYQINAESPLLIESLVNSMRNIRE
jgi:hypothetical protein